MAPWSNMPKLTPRWHSNQICSALTCLIPPSHCSRRWHIDLRASMTVLSNFMDAWWVLSCHFQRQLFATLRLSCCTFLAGMFMWIKPSVQSPSPRPVLDGLKDSPNTQYFCRPIYPGWNKVDWLNAISSSLGYILQRLVFVGSISSCLQNAN